ncbi:hypothetical protein ES703_67701 [subsurface metagenome]
MGFRRSSRSDVSGIVLTTNNQGPANARPLFSSPFCNHDIRLDSELLTEEFRITIPCYCQKQTRIPQPQENKEGKILPARTTPALKPSTILHLRGYFIE